MTIVGRYCEKFIEAGWLIALVLAAVFLNPFSDQVFEPDKAALLRAVATLMTGAWIIRALDSGAPSLSHVSELSLGRIAERALNSLRANPIAGLALLLLLAQIASTMTSIAPRVSWWGSYERAQGTYTLLAYLVLFFAVLTLLRHEDQLQRLISVLLFTSFPVAVYGVLQHYGMSLLEFTEAGIVTRVISTLGNAIFLAAYLAMVMPLALWRLMDSVRQWQSKPMQSAIRGFLYGGLLLAQLAAIVFTQSRGPILALLSEFFTFFLLVALLKQRRGWALGTVLATAVIVAFLLALNIPGLPTDPLRDLPYLRRFGQMVGSGSTEVQARILAWQTTLEAIRAEPARAFLGYGPETMKSVLTSFMPAELWVLQGGGLYGTFDRAHNALFDALYSRGVVGVVIHLLLYGVILYQALRWLGLVQTRRRSRILMVMLAGGAIIGLIIPWLWRGDLALAGIGMPAGVLGGMVFYLVGQTVFLDPTAGEPELTGGAELDEGQRVLVAALLGAVVGHFVETQTGIEIVVTQAYFWVFTALIILVGSGSISRSEPVQAPTSHTTTRNRGRRGRRGLRRKHAADAGFPNASLSPVLAMALISAVLLGALSYAFVHGFNVPGARRPAQALIVTTWLFAGLIILVENERPETNAPWISEELVAYTITSLVWLLPFSLYHRMNAQTLDRLDASFLAFVAWMLLSVAGAAAALQWNGSRLRSITFSNRLILYPIIVLVALLVTWQVDVNRIRADIYEKVGKTAMGARMWTQTLPYFERAVALQPNRDQYYIHLGGAYVEQARMASDLETKEAWMAQAREVFERGRALALRDSDHPRWLGLMYRVWAEWAESEALRRQRLQRSLEYYLTAVSLNPQNPDLRLDLADAYLTLGQDDAAFAQYQHAVDIGSPDHLGRAYAGLADVYLVRGELDKAAEAYRQAMQTGRDSQEVLQARISAASNRPDDLQTRLSLALVYAGADRQQDALNELTAALEAASTDAERARVERVIAMVEE